MKKKDLLKILEKQCVFKELCKTYHDKYKDLLNAFSDDEEICGIYILEGKEFKSKENFDAYLKENEKTPATVSMMLNSLYDSLVDFSRNPNEARQRAAKKNMRKASRVRIGFVTGGLIAVAVAILTVTVLGLVNIIPRDLSDTLSSLFGTLDCLFGIIFFVYEIINDKIIEGEIDAGNPEVIGKYVKMVGIAGDVKAEGNAEVIGIENNYADGQGDGWTVPQTEGNQNMEITGIGGSAKASDNSKITGIANNYSSRKDK